MLASKLVNDGGPEVQAAAKIALTGPADQLHEFLEVGQYMADRKDKLARPTPRRCSGCSTKPTASPPRRARTAGWPPRPPATAKNAKDEANKAAAEAQKSADQAGKYAADAKKSAAQAQTSADQAADSAKTARSAADRADQDAANADESRSHRTAAGDRPEKVGALRRVRDVRVRRRVPLP